MAVQHHFLSLTRIHSSLFQSVKFINDDLNSTKVELIIVKYLLFDQRQRENINIFTFVTSTFFLLLIYWGGQCWTVQELEQKFITIIWFAHKLFRFSKKEKKVTTDISSSLNPFLYCKFFFNILSAVIQVLNLGLKTFFFWPNSILCNILISVNRLCQKKAKWKTYSSNGSQAKWERDQEQKFSTVQLLKGKFSQWWTNGLVFNVVLTDLNQANPFFFSKSICSCVNIWRPNYL